MSANGQLTAGELAVIPLNDDLNTSGAQYVVPAMIPYLLAVAGIFRQQMGVKLFVKEAYRTYATQEDYFTTRYVQTPSGTVIWLGKRWSKKSQAVATAAVPGTSNHGWGIAMDLWSGIDSSFQSQAHLGFVAIAKAYGFHNTGTAFGEPWHFEWRAEWVTVTGDFTLASAVHPVANGGTITPGTAGTEYQEEDMSQADIDELKAGIANLGNIVTSINNALQDPKIGVLGTSNRAAAAAEDVRGRVQAVQNAIDDPKIGLLNNANRAANAAEKAAAGVAAVATAVAQVAADVWNAPIAGTNGNAPSAGRRLAGIDRLKENVSTIGADALAAIVAKVKGQ